MPKILSGKPVAEAIKSRIKRYVSSLKETCPRLACIIVGNNSASQSYVRSKVKACKECGINSKVIELPENVSEATLLWEIAKLNSNRRIDGIMVQLPLPKHINTQNILNHINPDKDVDGFTTINQGKLILQDDSGFIPATPLGITYILNYYNIDVSGKNCVILGRSNIVGKPITQLMLQRNATVTVLHSYSKNITTYLTNADIVIIAIGNPLYINRDMLKDDAVVIDVGINRITPQIGKPFIVGDFDPKNDSIESNISYTPVPGGVGLTTVACLLENTIKAHEKRKI